MVEKNNNGWIEYRKLVLQNIEDLSIECDDLNKRIRKLEDHRLKEKTRNRIIMALVGLIPTAIAIYAVLK